MKRFYIVLLALSSLLLVNVLWAYEMSMGEVEETLQQQPDNIPALFRKARLFEQQNRLDEAIKVYRSIIKIDPQRPEAYNNLAAIYVKQGKLELAKQTIEQGMQAHPVYGTMQQNLVLINREMAARSYANALVDVERQIVLAEVDELHQPQTDSVDGTLVAKAEQEKARQKAEEEKRRQEAEAERRRQEAAEAKRRQEAAEAKRRQEEEEAKRRAEAERQRQLAQEQQRQAEAEKQRELNAAQEQQRTIAEAKRQVVAWAEAWSARNVAAYLGFYVKNYQPRADMSHEAWVKQRRYRLRSPKWIKVQLERIRVEVVNENTLKVKFLQRYQSNTYQDAGYKQLTLVKENGEWKIAKEEVIKAQ